MNNLFDRSKDKTDKIILEIEDDNLYENLDYINNLDLEIQTLNTKKEDLKDIFKNIGKEKFIDIYNNQGDRVKSIQIICKNSEGLKNSVLYTINDKYNKIDKEDVKYLTNKYDDSIISENVIYKVNNDMINKYSQVISDLIINCDEIEESDKEKIISASIEYSIKKGSIDELYNIKESYLYDINEIYQDIKPIDALQKPKKIK